MISESDRDNLRTYMPELLSARLGITNLRRSFCCPSPNHDDRDPSAHYYEKDNSVHCFGCSKTWDVFSLIGELDGIEGFAEQAQTVADAVGYRLDDSPTPSSGRPRPKPKPKPQLLFGKPRDAGGPDCLASIERTFGNLYAPGNEVGRRYLRWRGLDDGDAARFGLGFTRNPKEILPQFAVYEPEALGFISIPFFTDEHCSGANYCMVRTVSRGQIKNKEWRPRGIASPLWNEWMLSASVAVLYVTEGLIDAMALTKLTGGQVMALGGVANARRFSQVLYHVPSKSRPDKIVVCMDEDDEGRKTRDKICADLDKIEVKHAVMPPYPAGAKDADEWLMNGRNIDWDYEIHNSQTEWPLYYTRWL